MVPGTKKKQKPIDNHFWESWVSSYDPLVFLQKKRKYGVEEIGGFMSVFKEISFRIKMPKFVSTCVWQEIWDAFECRMLYERALLW